MPEKRRRDANGAAWRTARSRVRSRVKTLGARCHLCDEPIDLTLPPLDPMSFEPDHIVPVSKGGHATAQRNLAPSHRAGNRRRGDMPLEKYLALGLRCADIAAGKAPAARTTRELSAARGGTWQAFSHDRVPFDWWPADCQRAYAASERKCSLHRPGVATCKHPCK